MISPIPYTVIIVRYNELGLKSPKVRRRMEKRLSITIELICKREKLSILKSQNRWGRLLYHFHPDQIPRALTVFFGIIGIHSFSPGVEVASNYLAISTLTLQIAQNYFKNKTSFAIRARRLQSFPMTSTEINQELGQLIIDNFTAQGKELSVNLSSPDKVIYLDVRDIQTYIYTDIYYSKWGGNPIEPDKAVVAWVENDLEDVIAAHMFIHRGAIALPVVFRSIDTLMEESPLLWNGLHILASYLPLPLPLIYLNITRLIEFWHQRHPVPDDSPVSVEIFINYTKILLLNELCNIFNQTEEFTYLNFPLRFHGVISPHQIHQIMFLQIGQWFSMPYFVPLSGLDSEIIDQYKRHFLTSLTPENLTRSPKESFSFIGNVLSSSFSSHPVQEELFFSNQSKILRNKLEELFSNQDLRDLLDEVLHQRSLTYITDIFLSD